jgi:hypothetical protein
MPLMQAFCCQLEKAASAMHMSTKGAKRLCGKKNKQINLHPHRGNQAQTLTPQRAVWQED